LRYVCDLLYACYISHLMLFSLITLTVITECTNRKSSSAPFYSSHLGYSPLSSAHPLWSLLNFRLQVAPPCSTTSEIIVLCLLVFSFSCLGRLGGHRGCVEGVCGICTVMERNTGACCQYIRLCACLFVIQIYVIHNMRIDVAI